MAAEVWAGLARADRRIACKYFYDGRGSELFERICELPEYYPTRTEIGILQRHAAAIAGGLGPQVRLVEFGSGSSTKTRLLLDALTQPAAYVPIDISPTMLAQATAGLRARYPRLPIEPLCLDYFGEFALPPRPASAVRTVAFFPGSTIGNFLPAEAVAFLQRVVRLVGARGGLLIGVDLQKPTSVLLPAYNDDAGVTAEFNRNALLHLNRELRCDFDPAAFEHRAIWNGQAGRIEMQLISGRAQSVDVAGRRFEFRRGEVLTTEYSHKYTLDGFADLAQRGGFDVDRAWVDPQRWFSVQLLRAR